MTMLKLFFAVLALCFSCVVRAERLELIWPTPNTAYFEGKPLETFVQSTASGVTESGLFGCRRSGGSQFHEGIDLKPVKRDRQGEPVDPIFAVMPGIVRYISVHPGNSNYGRYIVIEHTEQTPAVYTLYAHLAKIAPGLSIGARVESGQTLATMGRSSNGQAIPRDRAHLHFEIGLALTQNFQGWYNGKKFGSKNDHGSWNGMNLVGLDPLDFYDQLRARRVDGFKDYFARMNAAVKVRVTTARIPDFVQRYPSLVTKPLPLVLSGWEISFNELGLPFAWTPLESIDVIGTKANAITVVSAEASVLKQSRCKSLVVSRSGRLLVGRDLDTVLQLLLGLR